MTRLYDALGAMPWLLLAMSRLSDAYCECGYSVNKTTDTQHEIFTDLIENDFLHTSKIEGSGWRPQEYNVSAKDARGPYGKQFLPENIVPNPLKDKKKWGGESKEGGDAGLQLWVRGDHSKGFISASEMASDRKDTLYGSYRVGMKLSASQGTCGAFFWFFDNAQEIDLEFLSKQFNASQGAVNLVLQSPDSVKNMDASNTSTFRVQHLPFRPDEKFHEYRFDWTKDRVSFFVDGNWLWDMTDNVPKDAGTLFLNHWSNGDPLWSAGPVNKDTVMTVSYIKAYFNSGDEQRKKDYTKRCPTMDPAKVCEIPHQSSPPTPGANEDDEAGKTYFFSQDPKHAPNQTVAASGSIRQTATSLCVYVPLFVALFSGFMSI
ncbi:concanavalin A-like lectin/glucanase [Delitschia confertaspora ATCC 74209]|uniref:Concanavalin A-like lectin/glucanase n=1 Tax=Delitschia confertaspora ATCC 74209 TaxID=1513339 RepID=A0A9P4JHG3_9PLEO|nr:concanavalin A-like lectin/glucanase [Delitschia confertaspora ATCC 74209]